MIAAMLILVAGVALVVIACLGLIYHEQNASWLCDERTRRAIRELLDK